MPGDGPHNARDKTVTVLLHIRVPVPDALVPFRDDGLTLHAADDNRHRVMPFFRHEDGRVLAPMAPFVRDQMLADELLICSQVQGSAATEAFDRVYASARNKGSRSARSWFRRTSRASLPSARRASTRSPNAVWQSIGLGCRPCVTID